MQKVYGSPKRQDCLVKVGRNTYELIYGFGKDHKDDEVGWNWRQRFNHLPTLDEVKETINNLINDNTQTKIRTSFSWNGKPVWLSTENQINFKTAYDLAVMKEGATLPIKFKLGEDETGAPIYHTFTKLESFYDFIEKLAKHINECLAEGWNEKDSVDYSKFTI